MSQGEEMNRAIVKLEAALEWYANEDHYDPSFTTLADLDRGARAREALKP